MRCHAQTRWGQAGPREAPGSELRSGREAEGSPRGESKVDRALRFPPAMTPRAAPSSPWEHRYLRATLTGSLAISGSGMKFKVAFTTSPRDAARAALQSLSRLAL